MPAGSLRRRAASRTAPLTARAGVLALVTVNRRVRPWLSGNGISGEPVKRLLAKLGVKTDWGSSAIPNAAGTAKTAAADPSAGLRSSWDTIKCVFK